MICLFGFYSFDRLCRRFAEYVTACNNFLLCNHVIHIMFGFSLLCIACQNLFNLRRFSACDHFVMHSPGLYQARDAGSGNRENHIFIFGSEKFIKILNHDNFFIIAAFSVYIIQCGLSTNLFETFRKVKMNLTLVSQSFKI